MSSRASGMTMGVVGVLLLLLNALDYVLGWDSIHPGIGIIGLVFAVIGAGIVRRSKTTST